MMATFRSLIRDVCVRLCVCFTSKYDFLPNSAGCRLLCSVPKVVLSHTSQTEASDLPFLFCLVSPTMSETKHFVRDSALKWHDIRVSLSAEGRAFALQYGSLDTFMQQQAVPVLCNVLTEFIKKGDPGMYLGSYEKTIVEDGVLAGVQLTHENPHLQFWLYANPPVRPSTVKNALIAAGLGTTRGYWQEPHCRPSSTNGASALEKYVVKHDSTWVSGPYSNLSADELKFKTPLSEADLIPLDRLYTYQKQILAYLRDAAPHDRLIMWFHDNDITNCGKSEIQKRILLNKYTAVLPVDNARNMIAMAAALGQQKVYIAELTRGRLNGKRVSQEFYAALETVKGSNYGSAFGVKHEQIKGRRPAHMLVFANQPPDRQYMGDGRVDEWVIFRSDKADGTRDYVMLTAAAYSHKKRMDEIAAEVYRKAEAQAIMDLLAEEEAEAEAE